MLLGGGAVAIGAKLARPFIGRALGWASSKIKKALGFGDEAVDVTKGAKELNPKLIQENPRNLIPTQTKSDMSGSQVKRLTKDMKQNGFDQSKPVDAWRNPNTGRLEIQDGHHRTEAAKKAGLDKIPVQVWE
ncbi:ParB-like nuclease domain-containing protein [Vibrio vulnificus]|nr:ParB-like nuclease domain-containing protein [Vibrio vulnificus]